MRDALDRIREVDNITEVTPEQWDDVSRDLMRVGLRSIRATRNTPERGVGWKRWWNLPLPARILNFAWMAHHGYVRGGPKDFSARKGLPQCPTCGNAMVSRYFHWNSILCWPRNVLSTELRRSAIFTPTCNWLQSVSNARTHDLGRILRTAWTAYIIWWAYARTLQLGRPPDLLTRTAKRALARAIKGLNTVTILDICEAVDKTVLTDSPDLESLPAQGQGPSETQQNISGASILENGHPS